MNRLANGVAHEYGLAFKKFLDSPKEAALKEAYDCGRKALEQKVSLLELIASYNEVLQEALLGAKTFRDHAELSRRANSFLMESLSAFEIAHQGYVDAIAALRAHAEDLKRSNAELELFASAASHDLEEPLRKIAVFGDLLKTRYGTALGPEGEQYLERMQKAAVRLSKRIQDLLQFSRIGAAAARFETVDLNAVLGNVLSDLEGPLRRSGGRVRVDTLGQVKADPLQMERLFQNLIGNALKFRKQDQPPLVHIKAERCVDGMLEVSVQDNGIGFDEGNAGRLFHPFQRLHNPAQYEGTGMGLAICKRIISRHGGEIRVRSKPGEGSTFYVTLPLAAP